jgi:hypothetical protein
MDIGQETLEAIGKATSIWLGEASSTCTKRYFITGQCGSCARVIKKTRRRESEGTESFVEMRIGMIVIPEGEGGGGEGREVKGAASGCCVR